MSTKLSIAERQILVNQYRILSILDEANKEDHELNIEVLYKGFEGEYDSVIEVYKDSDIKTLEVCNETNEILNMFRRIDNALVQYDETELEGIDVDKLRFKGFDANNDPHYYYAEFQISKRGRWQEQKDKNLNSHSVSTLRKYRKMIEAMKNTLGSERFDLELKDLKFIVENS